MNLDGLLADDPARDDKLILVDGLDREVGTATKLEAHVEGFLHRAFSVVLAREGEGGVELSLEDLEGVSGGWGRMMDGGHGGTLTL